jgi:hypothetical protein
MSYARNVPLNSHSLSSLGLSLHWRTSWFAFWKNLAKALEFGSKRSALSDQVALSPCQPSASIDCPSIHPQADTADVRAGGHGGMCAHESHSLLQVGGAAEGRDSPRSPLVFGLRGNQECRLLPRKASLRPSSLPAPQIPPSACPIATLAQQHGNCQLELLLTPLPAE